MHTHTAVNTHPEQWAAKCVYVRVNHSWSSFIYRRSEYKGFLWIFGNCIYCNLEFLNSMYLNSNRINLLKLEMHRLQFSWPISISVLLFFVSVTCWYRFLRILIFFLSVTRRMRETCGSKCKTLFKDIVKTGKGWTPANRYCTGKTKSNPETGVGQSMANVIQRARQKGNPTDRL